MPHDVGKQFFFSVCCILNWMLTCIGKSDVWSTCSYYFLICSLQYVGIGVSVFQDRAFSATSKQGNPSRLVICEEGGQPSSGWIICDGLIMKGKDAEDVLTTIAWLQYCRHVMSGTQVTPSSTNCWNFYSSMSSRTLITSFFSHPHSNIWKLLLI